MLIEEVSKKHWNILKEIDRTYMDINDILMEIVTFNAHVVAPLDRKDIYYISTKYALKRMEWNYKELNTYKDILKILERDEALLYQMLEESINISKDHQD